MPVLEIDRDARLALRARAHALKPVVLLGNAGLSAAALKEIDRALSSHELIKVRVPGDDREAREDILARIVEALDAAPVQAIGKLLVLWRPKPPEEAVQRERPLGRARAPRGALPARPAGGRSGGAGRFDADHSPVPRARPGASKAPQRRPAKVVRGRG